MREPFGHIRKQKAGKKKKNSVNQGTDDDSIAQTSLIFQLAFPDCSAVTISVDALK